MYPGLPSRLERELKQLYLERVLNGNTEAFQAKLFFEFIYLIIFFLYVTLYFIFVFHLPCSVLFLLLFILF